MNPIKRFNIYNSLKIALTILLSAESLFATTPATTEPFVKKVLTYESFIDSSYTENPKEEIQRIRDYAREKSQKKYNSKNNPEEIITVWKSPFLEDSLEVRVGAKFTSFYDEGNANRISKRYYFDRDNDGEMDVIIFTRGQITEQEKEKIEIEGLQSTNTTLKDTLLKRQTTPNLEGATPYDLRVIILKDTLNSVKAYNFQKREILEIENGTTFLRGEYKVIIKELENCFRKQ